MCAQINIMKKYFIISILMFSQIISFAQKTKVTTEAQKAFQTKFPTAKEVKWEMEAFAGATIKEVYKIESKEGKNYFEIEYSLKGKTKEAKLDLTGKIM